MFTTKAPHYFELSKDQRKLFAKIYLDMNEFTSLMQIAKVAHSSELSHPFTVAHAFYFPLFSNLHINFERFNKSDFDYLVKLLIHLQSRFHSGMINKAMRAYNILSVILKDLTEFTDNFQE